MFFTSSFSTIPFFSLFFFFFFNDTATTEIYTLSLHDALPISVNLNGWIQIFLPDEYDALMDAAELVDENASAQRSEEHTSELQSQSNLVCRLLLEKKKKNKKHSNKTLQNKTQDRSEAADADNV